ncbi:MAG: hypothetical protein AAEJ53_16960 [Myxococcota bacterium]
MSSRRIVGVAVALAALFAGNAQAYPGGTPSFQTDAAPYCASCHASREAAVLEGAGERADKEVAERKHLSLVLAGEKGYEALSPADRKSLADQIRALDAASTVSLEAPASVKPGRVFQVKVSVTGGAGPVVGVALVDAAHRWYARPIASAGFTVVEAPEVTGADGEPRDEWIERRPESMGHGISYVNIPGIHSDAAAGSWDSAEVVFTLRAPERAGSYPMAAAYFYGTEKSTVLGYTTTPTGWKQVRGGMFSSSGRLAFTPVQQIQVVGSEPAPAAQP